MAAAAISAVEQADRAEQELRRIRDLPAKIEQLRERAEIEQASKAGLLESAEAELADATAALETAREKADEALLKAAEAVERNAEAYQTANLANGKARRLGANVPARILPRHAVTFARRDERNPNAAVEKLARLLKTSAL